MSSRKGAARVGQNRLYYGWVVVSALFLGVMISSGVRFAAGPFLKPMTEELGMSRGSLSFIIGLSLLLYGVVMPFAGRLVDQKGPRPVMIGSSIILAIALIGTGLSRNPTQVFIFYGLLAAVGFSGLSQVTATSVIAAWFDRRRGLANNMISASAMAAMAVFNPVVTWLILRFGWNTAFVLLAVPILLICIPLVHFFIRSSPEEMGLAPDGDVPQQPTAGSNEASVSSTSALAQQRDQGPLRFQQFGKTRVFWLLAASFFSCGFSMNLMMTHGQPMLTDHGFHEMTAAGAMGFLGVVSIFGGIAIGALSDYVGRRGLLALIYATRGVGFALLLFVRDPIALYLVAGIAGVFWAGSAGLTSSLSGDLFGRRSVGTIFGTLFLSHQVGAFLSSVIGGYLFDITGSYTIPFLLTTTLLGMGAVLALLVDEKGKVVIPPLPSMAASSEAGRA